MKGGTVQYNYNYNKWNKQNENIYSILEAYILNNLNIKPICDRQNSKNKTKFTGEIFYFPRRRHKCFNKSFAQAYNNLNDSIKKEVNFLIKTAIDNRIHVSKNYIFDTGHDYFLNSLQNTYNYLRNNFTTDSHGNIISIQTRSRRSLSQTRGRRSLSQTRSRRSLSQTRGRRSNTQRYSIRRRRNSNSQESKITKKRRFN